MIPLGGEENWPELAYRIDMADADRAATGRAFDLVALDLDGTLLDTSGEFSTGIQEAIRAALQQGVVVSVVTGRGKLALLPYLRELELRTPYVASGGACIASPGNGHAVQQLALAWEDVVALAGMGRAVGASLFFESADWMMLERAPGSMDWSTGARGFRLPVVEDVVRSAPSSPTKVSIVGDPDILARVERQARQRVPSLTMTYTSPHCVDFYPAGVNKGSGLARLAEHLGVDLQRTAVVGDYYNDLSMFEVAGLAIAMGNAPADVRAAADLVAPANDEGGAAWALQQVLQMTAAGLVEEACAPAPWARAGAPTETSQHRE